jgi:Protein of unknown function (DUF2948)
MAPDDSPALKLRAEDADDLAVLSACLQDALVAVRDLGYLAAQQEFVLVTNRFCWEGYLRPCGETEANRRVLCAVSFFAVENVAYRGFRRTEEDRILSLLAIRDEPGTSGRTILLDFAGGASIRLEVAEIRCRVRDWGEPWPTPWRPRHEEEALS